MHLTNSLNIGGLETLLLSLLGQIDRKLISPTVCTMTPSSSLIPEFEAAEVEVFTLNKKQGLDSTFLRQLVRLLKSQDIDVLHTHNFGAWFYGAIAGKLAGVSVVNTEHSNVPSHNKRRVVIERWLSKLSHKVICDSQAVLDYMTQYQKIPPHKSVLILNGVDCERFGSTGDTATFRKTLDIDPHQTAIGIVARLVPVKNHSGLLQAIKVLMEQTSAFKLIIVGDGPEKSSLQELSKQLGLNDVVTFTGARRDIPQIMSALDIFVLNSFSEGLPITLLEAMAARKSVVATRVGGIPEILGNDGQAGTLVPRDNPAAVANALEELIQDKDKRTLMGLTARERVLQKASLGSMSRSYEAVYQECVAD